jgi:multiple sugar transport system permease protein
MAFGTAPVSRLREGARPAERRESLAGWAFVTPALVVIGAFFLLPVIAGFVLSFTDFDIYAIADPSNARVVGLRNYARLLHDPVFWTACRNTLYFVVVGTPLTLGASLGAALLVNAKTARWKGLFRTIYFTPVVTTLVAIAIVWRYIFNARFGPLNHLLGFAGVPPVDWLGDPRFAMPSIIVMYVWRSFGYNMILFVAGLQGIPESLYEAARLDGAAGWRLFRHVTLPMLKPTTVFVAIITIISAFQIFAEPYVMTNGGGPLNATLSIVLYMYQEGFRWWNLGYASAVAFVLFLAVLAATFSRIRSGTRRDA